MAASPISSRSVSPHGEKNGNGINGQISTDEDEIDEKIHILLKRLEAKLDNPTKPISQKQKTKSKVTIKVILEKNVSNLT